MKKVLAQGTKYLFGAFGLAILGLLMSLTYQALGRIFPGSFENQIWGLILFDVAAICWALAFVFASETVGQYAVAALGFLVGFCGTLLMVGAEVMLGQNMTPVQTEQIGQWMVYGFIAATALHAILLYSHHATGKEIKQRIDIGIARGEVTTEAIKQATAQLDVEKAALAKTISDDMISQVKRDLGLYPIQDTVFDRRSEPREFNYSTEEILNEVKDISSILPYPTDAIAQELPKYNHMRPPNGDRQHPDLLLNRLPLGVWQRISQEWEAHDNALRASTTQEAGETPSPFLKG